MHYKIRFYRYNSAVEPIIKQESDVLFITDAARFSDEFDSAMYEAMWKQNPHWILPHGPKEIGYRGWSSVMWGRDSLEIVKPLPYNIPQDLTGDGNMSVPMTYHPLLPNDLRASIKSAYERGLADEKAKTANKRIHEDGQNERTISI